MSSVCARDNKCDLAKALPMMTGIFWYQINDVIFHRLCPQHCHGRDCNYLDTFRKVMEDSESLIMYAKSLPSYWAETWKTFFFDAVTVQAFTNTRVTLSMVKEKASDFEFAAKQCSVIKSPKACSNSALLEQYKLLKDMQYNKNKDVKLKDLRKHSQMDYAQMMKLQKDNLQQLQLLGGIKKLDDNLQASVSGISKYFEGLAKFDQGIATADAGFLKGELDKYETSLKNC
ncbi:hypothetical protein QZH41_007720 [Actinostola sp. cb2023]|nr:hypothetical protein QZH41_007720 [Actinostola sp. cb2023]